jgi:hypothetical protein
MELALAVTHAYARRRQNDVAKRLPGAVAMTRAKPPPPPPPRRCSPHDPPQSVPVP